MAFYWDNIYSSKIALRSSQRYSKNIYTFITFAFSNPSYLLKRRRIIFNWVKAVKVLCICFQTVRYITMKDHIVGMHEISIKLINLEIN